MTNAIAEMKAFYDDYLEGWNSADPATLPSLYAYPWVSVGGSGISVTMDQTKQRDMWTQLWDGLKQRGWARTGADRVDAYPMGNDTGLLDVDYVRYRADNSVLERGRSHYIVQRTAGRWKIIALLEPPRR